MLTKQRFVSRDVQFYEHVFPFQQQSLTQYMHPIPTPISSTHSWPDEYIQTLMTEQYHDQSSSPGSSHPVTDQDTHHSIQSPPSPDPPVSPTIDPSPPPVVPPPSNPSLRRSVRSHKPPSWLTDYVTPTQNTSTQHPMANV